MKKINVAAYCRVSTDKDDQINSLHSQRIYFEEYIKNHRDWNLINVYYDEGISGTQTAKRQGFLDMIEDASNGEIDLILTKEVSRFARNTVDTLSYTRKLKAMGVRVIFTIDNIDTSDSDGELRLTIMASIAQEESRKTSERVKWGQKRRMEQGVVFGRDLLGYTVHNGELQINETEVPVIRSIFHKYVNEGKGTCTIARELIEEGMYPKRGDRWSNTMILKILRNEKYVGDLCQKKTFTPDYLTHAKKYNHGEEEMIYIKDHHAPIIDRKLWERTQEELKWRSNSDEGRSKHNNRYWYSGRLFCGQCGSRYVSRTRKRKDGSVYKSFRCCKNIQEGTIKVNSRGDTVGCSNGQINEKILIESLNYILQHIQISFAEIKKEILDEIKKLKRTKEQRGDGLKTKKEIEKLRNQKAKTMDLLVKGLISEEEFIDQKEWYDRKISHLVSDLQKEIEDERILQSQVLNMNIYMEELEKMMKFDYDNSSIYQEILNKITIYNDKSLDVQLKCLPFFIHVVYCTHGKGDTYQVKIKKIEFPDMN